MRNTRMRTLGQLVSVAGIALGAMLAGCSEKHASTEASTPEASVVTVPAHNYTVADGREYGYPRAVSENEQNAGQVAGEIMMFRYAGERNGKHQVLMSQGMLIAAFECANPCQVIKVMTIMDNPALAGQVSIERLQYNPSSVAGAAIEDAINGRLEQFEEVDDQGRKSHLWVDEKAGLRRKRVES